jgi:GMP synthase (glutamine-hydrolysing)
MKHGVTVLKAGSTHPEIADQHGDFEDWVTSGLGLPSSSIEVIDLQQHESLNGRRAKAIVITGAHEHITDGQPWMRNAAEWIRHMIREGVPVLGICYGHQLLAHSLGGEVDFHPGGREVGTVSVRVLPDGGQDALLGTLPSVFRAHCSHAQSVLALPEGAVRLATSEFEATQAFRFGSSAWGVQFHPEFTESIMVHYIERQRRELEEQGLNADLLIAEVTQSPASVVLERFAALVNAV